VSRRRKARLAGNVEAPPQHQAEVPLGGPPGVFDRVAVLLGAHPADGRRVRRAGELGVPDPLPGHVAGDLIRQQPHVLGRPDEVDHRQVELDEPREVGEGEVRRQLVGVFWHW